MKGEKLRLFKLRKEPVELSAFNLLPVLQKNINSKIFPHSVLYGMLSIKNYADMLDRMITSRTLV